MTANPFDPLLSRFNAVPFRHMMIWLAGIYLVLLAIGYLRFDQGRGILGRLLVLLFVFLLPPVFGSWLQPRLPAETPSAEEWEAFRTRENARRRRSWDPVRAAHVIRYVCLGTLVNMALFTPVAYAIFVLVIPRETLAAVMPDTPRFLTWFGVAAACSLVVALGKALTQAVQAARYWKRAGAGPPAA